MLKGFGENCMKSRTGLCVTIFFVVCSSVLLSYDYYFISYSLVKYFVSVAFDVCKMTSKVPEKCIKCTKPFLRMRQKNTEMFELPSH